MTIDDANKFSMSIVSEVQSGAAFIPIIGAGVSASAGIPTIRNLTIYLNYCLKLAINREWFPQQQPWPALSSAFSDLSEVNSVKSIHKELIRLGTNGLEESIVLAAIGALSDWRESLRFLSRLTL